MKRIATVNFKGGVGKTTVTWLLARQLAERFGKPTLVFDTDAQMSLTFAVEILESGAIYQPFGTWYEKCIEEKTTILNAILGYEDFTQGKKEKFDFSVEKMIFPFEKNLHFIPAVVDLYWIELGIVGREALKGSMPEVLKLISMNPHLPKYDFAFFDCPPSFNLLSFSVFNSIDLILIPINPDAFASRGLRTLLEGLDLRIKPNPIPKIGVFMNKAKILKERLTRESEMYWEQIKQGCESFSSKGFNITPIESYVPDRADIKRAIPRGHLPPKFENYFITLWQGVETLL